MHYLLFYEKAPDYAARQKPWQNVHREYFEKLAAQGDLILGGSLEDPVDGSAVLHFKAASVAAVEAFAQNDPYVQNGIVTKWRVRPWDVVVGSALSPG